VEDDDEGPLAGKRVLLAEDDPVAREIVAAALQGMGLDVMISDDGGRMMVAVASHYKAGRTPADLDLVVTDVQMPVTSGLEVVKALRKARWQTPVIVVTAFESPEVREIADQLDAVLLEKPIDIHVLKRVVRKLLLSPPEKRRSGPLS